jgi:vacuolar-type H+-ATPase subunit H
MAKKQKRAHQELESLIPSIKSEERHLADQLEKARAEAERLIQEAEKEAEARVERAKADLPGFLEVERTTRMESLRHEAEETLHTARGETDYLERVAAGRLGEAVAYIVSRVWPARTNPRGTEARPNPEADR